MSVDRGLLVILEAQPGTDENGRQAHLNGPIAAALGQAGPGLLAKEPEIQRTDILATK